MKSFTVAAIAAIAAPALAQVGDFPTCATGPALAAFGSSGCGTTDIACICSNQAFIASLVPAIEAACSPAEVQTALAAAQTLCTSAGVPLVLPTATSSSSAAPSTSVPASSVSSAASSISSALSSVGYAASSLSTSYPTATGGGNGTHPYPTGGYPVYTGAATTVAWDKAAALAAAGVMMALL